MPPRRTPPRQQTRGTRTGTHRRQTDTHLSHANTGRGERISEMVLRHPASFQSRRRFLRCSFRGAQSARHVSRRATTTRSAIASAASVSTLPPPRTTFPRFSRVRKSRAAVSTQEGGIRRLLVTTVLRARLVGAIVPIWFLSSSSLRRFCWSALSPHRVSPGVVYV